MGRETSVVLAPRPAVLQLQISPPASIRPHILDFFCREAWVDIELDGFQHGTREQQAKDVERDAFLEARGIKVLRFWNSRLRCEKDAIRDTIWRTLQERAPHPPPDYCQPMPPPDEGEGKTVRS